MSERPSDSEEEAKRREARLQRVLKIAIAVMSLALVVGFLVVFGTILARMGGGTETAVRGGALSLPGQAVSMALDGDRLAVIVEAEAGRFIVVYDIARGREIGRVELDEAR